MIGNMILEMRETEEEEKLLSDRLLLKNEVFCVASKEIAFK